MIENIIKSYEDGSNITFMNSYYIKPKKMENGKMSKDCLTIIYKDNDTGEKHFEEIYEPEYEFYMLKDDIPTPTFNEIQVKVTDLIRYICKYNQLEKTLCEMTGNIKNFYACLQSGNRKAISKIHNHKRIFNSDQNINDHYRDKFNLLYKNDVCPITKGYLDIEVDIKNLKGKLDDEYGLHPINAVTYVDDNSNIIYTFILNYNDNKLTYEFKDYCNTHDFSNEVKEFIKTYVGGWKNEIRFKLNNMTYKQFFFEDEIVMLQSLFDVINFHKPDFLMAWNMAFDIPYIIERIKYLGYSPEEIMCCPEFKNKKCYYYIDEFNKMDFAERGDYAVISSYTVYIDQMIQFASRRKNGKKLPKYSLDYVGEIVTGVRKYSYNHIVSNLEQLPYVDFKTFIIYNIIDTIVQKLIEDKSNDINYLFAKCINNNTRYEKCHRNTVYLTNRLDKFSEENGYILSNNFNKDNVKPQEPIYGALVGEPTHLSEELFIKINNVLTGLIDNCVDFDFKALYPSIIHQFNLAINTIIGKILIDDKIYEKENQFNMNIFERGSKFIEDYITRNIIIFCSRWLKLANFNELCDDVEEYFTTIKPNLYSGIGLYNSEGLINSVGFIDNNILGEAIRLLDEKELVNNILFIHNENNIDNFIKENVNYEEYVPYREAVSFID